MDLWSGQMGASGVLATIPPHPHHLGLQMAPNTGGPGLLPTADSSGQG